MILQALAEYYYALEKNGEISRAGWGNAKVGFALCLNEKGELTKILPLKEDVYFGKKKVEKPRDTNVPARVSRTSLQVKANFLCDNASYLLGIGLKGDPEKRFNASSILHQKLLLNVDCIEAQAICLYFKNWDTESASEHPAVMTLLEDLKVGNIVFRVENRFAHDVDMICEAWNIHSMNISGDKVMQCLITGKYASVARLHQEIKGLRDAQPRKGEKKKKQMPRRLVSFNRDAFESYGQTQGYISPVSEKAAFAYTTALNYLLADQNRCIYMGDSTMVFWAETSERVYQDSFKCCLDPQSEFNEADLMQIMQKVARGNYFELDGLRISPETKFYILGLSPNAARIAVRFFYRNRFGDVASNILKHYERLEIAKPSKDNRKYLSIGNLLRETINKETTDDANPLLTGSTIRSVLNNTPYPAVLLSGVMLRIRAEQEINRGRAAIIKAFLIKNYENVEPLKEVLTVELNEQATFQPYMLGRLFAVLEKLQKDSANHKINRTIKDKYFNSACATPETIFPILIKLSQSHLRKLDTGGRIYFDKMITELTGNISETYPAHHTLEEQGAFQLGYYHQRPKIFDKKPEEE